MSVILTVLGNYFDIRKPMDYDYPIEEIAWHLSKINRFTGATLIDYSVARHSVYVSYLCNSALAFEALMHDASEAYLNDVVKPLKVLLPGYQRIESKVQGAIRFHYGLPAEESEGVKAADYRALRIERRFIMPDAVKEHPYGFAPMSPGRYKWKETTAVQDADAFLLRYYTLLSGISELANRREAFQQLDDWEEPI